MSVMNVDFDKLRIILMPHVLRQGGLLEALFRTAFVPLKSSLLRGFFVGSLRLLSSL